MRSDFSARLAVGVCIQRNELGEVSIAPEQVLAICKQISLYLPHFRIRCPMLSTFNLSNTISKTKKNIYIYIIF